MVVLSQILKAFLAEQCRTSRRTRQSPRRLLQTLFGEQACAEVVIGEYRGFESGPGTSMRSSSGTTFRCGRLVRRTTGSGDWGNRGNPVGYALFFHNFSTFTGRPGIYLEDIYVNPEMRGKGFGKSMLACIAKLAVDRNCSRVEWSVLDWNEPSIQFYRSIGAVPMDEWTVQRLQGSALVQFADVFKQSQENK